MHEISLGENSTVLSVDKINRASKIDGNAALLIQPALSKLPKEPSLAQILIFTMYSTLYLTYIFDHFLGFDDSGVDDGVLLSWPKFSPLGGCAVNFVHGQYKCRKSW